jgi:predicted secreted Zn-dependent protease
MMRSGVLALALLALPAAAEPAITEDVRFYPVTGATIADIRADLRTKRLRDMTGAYGDARTSWRVRWRFDTADGPEGGCALANVRVEIIVRTLAPELSPEAALSGEDRARFDAYHAALLRHENRHREIAVEGARRIEAALNATPSTASCGDIRSSANTRADAELDALNARSVAYDRATRHGRLEGARLP